MALPPLFRYYEYPMPTEKVLAYYNEHLKGTSHLHGYLPALSISKKLDAFTELPVEEQHNAKLYEEVASINKLGTWLEEGDLRIRTKYACARVVIILRTIEWHQKQIWDKISAAYKKYHVPARANLNAFSPDEIDTISRSEYLKEDFERMKSSLYDIHRTLESMKKGKLEEDFSTNVLPMVTHQVSMYYSVFGLDFRSDKEKFGEKAEGCLGEVIVTALLLGGVALLAMIFSR